MCGGGGAGASESMGWVTGDGERVERAMDSRRALVGAACRLVAHSVHFVIGPAILLTTTMRAPQPPPAGPHPAHGAWRAAGGGHHPQVRHHHPVCAHMRYLPGDNAALGACCCGVPASSADCIVALVRHQPPRSHSVPPPAALTHRPSTSVCVCTRCTRCCNPFPQLCNPPSDYPFPRPPTTRASSCCRTAS